MDLPAGGGGSVLLFSVTAPARNSGGCCCCTFSAVLQGWRIFGKERLTAGVEFASFTVLWIQLFFVSFVLPLDGRSARQMAKEGMNEEEPLQEFRP